MPDPNWKKYHLESAAFFLSYNFFMSSGTEEYLHWFHQGNLMKNKLMA